MLAAVRLQSLCRSLATPTHARQLLPLLPRVSAALQTKPAPQPFGLPARIASLTRQHSRSMAAAVSCGQGRQQPAIGEDLGLDAACFIEPQQRVESRRHDWQPELHPPPTRCTVGPPGPTAPHPPLAHTQAATGGLQMELVEVDNGGAEELNFILGGLGLNAGWCMQGWCAQAVVVDMPCLLTRTVLLGLQIGGWPCLPLTTSSHGTALHFTGRPGALHQDS